MKSETEELTTPLTNIFNEIIRSQNLTNYGKRKDQNKILETTAPSAYDVMLTLYKIFAKIIFRSIPKILDENQPAEQSGYSTMDS